MAFIFRNIRAAGGLMNALRQIVRMNEVRIGSVVGRDQFGNVYYENKEYFYGRNRWVDFDRKDVDASQVPPEWHHWLHHTTDVPPTKCQYSEQKFHDTHRENLSGTSQQYVPYSTTTEKVSAWKPN